MKKAALIFAILIFASCADKKSEANLTPGEVSIAKVSKSVKDKMKDKVPSLDFSELNTFLTKDNDSIYVVNFWATWCKPCIKELPAFEKLNTEYSDQKVKVILVSLDFPKKVGTQVIPFMEKNNIQSQVLLLDDTDANSWIPKISKKWSGAIPATLIYSNSARLFYEQSFTFEELEEELNKFI